MDWNMLPQDVLGIILMKYVTDSGETGSISLKTLQKRLWTAFSVCSSWKESVKQNSCMGDVHVRLDMHQALILGHSKEGKPSSSLRDFIYNTAVGLVILPSLYLQETEHMYPSSLLQNLGTIVPRLEYLEVELPDAWRKNSSFRSETIRSFHNLKELVLRKFTHYDLEHLPGSIEFMTLEYGEIWEKDILTSHSISIVDIPSDIFLRSLSVKKVGVLGVITRQVLGQVAHLTVDALYALVSVAVEDTDLLDVFQRPYREGAYVPPHILGDWNAVETSHRATDAACTILLESMSNALTFKSMTISGEGAQSLKIVPSLAGQEYGMLSWISSITEQASSLLYGMNGEEFQERLDALNMMGVINRKRIQIVVMDSSFRFQMNKI